MPSLPFWEVAILNVLREESLSHVLGAMKPAYLLLRD